MPSVITGVIGGIQGSSAAHDAAAAERTGYGQAATSVNNAVNNANPLINSAASAAGSGLTTTAGQVAGNVGAAGAAAGGGAQAAYQSSAGLNNPYLQLGGGAASTLAQLTAPGANVSQLLPQLDPGYQFRLSQGLQGVQQSQAANGLLNSGATLRALQNYGQNYASSEYANTFSRLAGLAGMGSQTAQYLGSQGLGAAEYAGNTGLQSAEYGGNLQYGAAGQAGQWGINAANTQASNLINAGVYQGNTQIGTGNATAQGDIGAANAWNGALGAIGSAGNAALFGGFGAGGGWSPSNFGPNFGFGAPTNPSLQYGYASPVGASPMGNVSIGDILAQQGAGGFA